MAKQGEKDNRLSDKGEHKDLWGGLNGVCRHH